MLLREVMDTSFVVLPSRWTISQGLRFLSQLEHTHVIIHRVEDFGEFYYLLMREELIAQLAAWNMTYRGYFSHPGQQ